MHEAQRFAVVVLRGVGRRQTQRAVGVDPDRQLDGQGWAVLAYLLEHLRKRRAADGLHRDERHTMGWVDLSATDLPRLLRSPTTIVTTLVSTCSHSIRRRRQRKSARFLERFSGGAGRDRTDDLKLAKLALSQLSYNPTGTADEHSDGLSGLEGESALPAAAFDPTHSSWT